MTSPSVTHYRAQTTSSELKDVHYGYPEINNLKGIVLNELTPPLGGKETYSNYSFFGTYAFYSYYAITITPGRQIESICSKENALAPAIDPIFTLNK